MGRVDCYSVPGEAEEGALLGVAGRVGEGLERAEDYWVYFLLSFVSSGGGPDLVTKARTSSR